MQYRSVTSFTLVALFSTATAQQQFRVFTRASQSVREFGVFGRQSDGYQPEDEICAGEGSTCAEACGRGYEQCYSGDEAIHCYNPAAGESCCSAGDGTSCLADYYCSHDSEADTWCCPDGSSLEECAQQFGVTGGLSSDLPAATSAPVVSSSGVAGPETSATSELSQPSEPSTTVSIVFQTSAVDVEPQSTSQVPSSGFTSAVANATSWEPSYTLPAPTTPEESDPVSPTSPGQTDDDVQAAAVAHGPVGAVLIAGCAVFMTAVF